jgi:uncharacterized membrane protein
MSLYLALKFVHVVAAIAWVGGGLCFSAFGTMLESRRDSPALLSLTRLLGTQGPALFMPAALVTLISGVALLTLGSVDWPAWSIFAIALMAVAFSMCAHIVNTAGADVVRLMNVGREAHAAVAARRLLRLMRFECATMMAIIALMVIKPGWGDLATLGLIAALLGLAALAFLVRPHPTAI